MNKKRIFMVPLFVAIFLNLALSFGVSAAKRTANLPLIPLKPGDQYQDPIQNGQPASADPGVTLMSSESPSTSGAVYGETEAVDIDNALFSWRLDRTSLCPEARVDKFRVSFNSEYFQGTQSDDSDDAPIMMFISQSGTVNTSAPVVYEGANIDDNGFAIVRGTIGKSSYLSTAGPVDGEWDVANNTALGVHIIIDVSELDSSSWVNATNLSAQVTYDDTACYPVNVTAPKSGDKYNFAVILVSGFAGAGIATTLIFCLGGKKKQTSK